MILLPLGWGAIKMVSRIGNGFGSRNPFINKAKNLYICYATDIQKSILICKRAHRFGAWA